MHNKRKTVFITGGATGIGLETAKKFITEGANVTIYSYDISGIPNEFFPADRILIQEGDICDREGVRHIIGETMKKFGALDVLINNAGVAERHAFVDSTEDQWDAMIAVNLRGMFIVTQEALSVMDIGTANKDHDGCVINRKHIINISSGAGLHGIPELAVYSATKAGVIAFSQALSGELSQKGIDVVVITPGSVGTDMFKKLFAGREARHTTMDVANVIYGVAIGDIKPDNRLIVDTFYHQRT